MPVKVTKIVPVRFFCITCGKEIWEQMHEYIKETTTIKEAEETAVCWDCTHKEVGIMMIAKKIGI